MIGIIGAMSVEVEGLRRLLTQRKDRQYCGITFSTGWIRGVRVTVAQSGVGKVLASMCAAVMCERFRPDLIINTGVAGSLSSELRIGDILVSEAAVQWDFDTSALDNTPKGYIGVLDTVRIAADQRAADVLLSAAGQLGVRAKRDIIATGDLFVADNNKKAELVQQFGASACEMEGGAIATVAAVNNVPFVILRAISDGADEGALIDFPKFVAQSAETSIRLLAAALPELNALGTQ